MLQELESLNESLNDDKLSLEEVTNDHDSIISLCNEKDKALQAAISEKRNMETRMTKLNKLVIEKEDTTQNEPIGTNQQDLQKLEDELKLCKNELHVAEETIRSLTTNKLVLDQRLSSLKKKNSKQSSSIQLKLEQERKTLKAKDFELTALKSNLKELEELREMKKDIDRKDKQTIARLNMQPAQLADIELLYKEEQVLRT
ncbi:hypothetical protein AHAS_Ahas15G0286900 [Arachis hypogaea]